MKKSLLTSILFLIVISVFGQITNATLYGVIKNNKGEPLELVSVGLTDYPIGSTSKQSGEYLLSIPSNRDIRIVFSMMGYSTFEKVLNLSSGESFELNVTLEEKTEQISEVIVGGRAQSTGNLIRIDPKMVNSLPSVGMGTVDGLIKTFAGVASTNELSSQYSVRGGSYDENLVYVNDIEVYRPFLIRSGQQEGLSFVNSDMVSSLEFSAGGFDAKFGDKMSSVLNITYKKPTEFRASASASFLGATAHIENISKNEKLTYNIGARYKTFQYLFGSLEEDGEYFPLFIDLQGYFTYNLSKKWELDFLGTISNNRYKFIPRSKKSEFGTWNIPLGVNIYYEGQEVDRYETYTGALSFIYKPTTDLQLKFIGSAFTTEESETYDIISYYNFNELENDSNSDQYGDSVLNIGVGMYQEYGRNFLNATVFDFTHKGSLKANDHFLQWGITAKQEVIDDKTHEWEYRDSAGYSLPYSSVYAELYRSAKTKYSHTKYRLTGFIQDSYLIKTSIGQMMVTGGFRAHYWSFTNKTTISPRFSAALKTKTGVDHDLRLRLSMGWYHQPAFYRELKDLDGNINFNIQTPRSFQIVAGADYRFEAWDRPFEFTGELYYKDMHDLIPYQYENVRLRYLSDQISDGFAVGTDLKVSGEFVSGVQSWASMSIMTTQEDIEGDGHRYIPRPSDQRFKFSLFFQDYFPGNPAYQMHLTGHFLTGMPYGMPRSERWTQTARMKSYRRIDIGFSRSLVSNGKNLTSLLFFNKLYDSSISIEVFNLLDTGNVSSYSWVADYDGKYYPVRNLLTGRTFNLKVSASF